MKDRFNFRIPAKMVLFLLPLSFLVMLVLPAYPVLRRASGGYFQAGF